MEKSDLITVFSNLDVNDKRNIYNEEMLKIYELLKTSFGISDDEKYKLHNYDSINEETITEDEYLTNEYKNLLMIREMLINCLFMKKQ